MAVIDFAGDGAKDCDINNGNPPPTASKGGKSVIDFAGKGGSDVDYNNIKTNSSSGGAQTAKSPSKPSSGGPIDSPVD